MALMIPAIPKDLTHSYGVIDLTIIIIIIITLQVMILCTSNNSNYTPDINLT